MGSAFDTIVAPITAVSGAVAVVRVSGDQAWLIAACVFLPWPAEIEPRKALYGRFVHGDDGLALPFSEGGSYTGERTVEFSTHGSVASVQGLVEACIRAGARLAQPGEFTLRAFLNGKLDLTQAEAVRDAVEAKTEAQLRAAGRNLQGVLREEVSTIRSLVLGVLAAVEAAVDFSEEIGPLDRESAYQKIQHARTRIQALLANGLASRITREGLRVAIVGPPNAGKSSLLNALLGCERSIVTDMPGTTRDYLEESLQIGGVPVVFIDTAGLRNTEDRIESIGIERTRRAISTADVVWFVFDAAIGLSERDQEDLARFEQPMTLVANKSDIATCSEGLGISALTGEGITDLLNTLRATIPIDYAGPTLNRRHEDLLQQADASLQLALEIVKEDVPADLLTVFLHEALSALGMISGETATPDVLHVIFSEFCVGK